VFVWPSPREAVAWKKRATYAILQAQDSALSLVQKFLVTEMFWFLRAHGSIELSS
jgi:hypothetical protein